jgi:LemA protein
MTRGQIVVLALAAVLVFWMVGAYNRLVALRNAIGDAWAKVQEALAQRGAALPPLVAALREPMAAEHGALDTLLAAHAEAVRAAAALAARPVDATLAQAWVGAESALAAAASRVFALLEQQDDLRAQEAVALPVEGWRAGQARLPYTRQLFNDDAAAYNEAAAVFPTRMLARLYGFGRAGQI